MGRGGYGTVTVGARLRWRWGHGSVTVRRRKRSKFVRNTVAYILSFILVRLKFIVPQRSSTWLNVTESSTVGSKDQKWKTIFLSDLIGRVRKKSSCHNFAKGVILRDLVIFNWIDTEFKYPRWIFKKYAVILTNESSNKSLWKALLMIYS